MGLAPDFFMGETRVDLLHLLEDLRDAYPGSLEETILTEIMANALDSGASLVSFHCDPAARALVVVDNGSGMQRRELARYHDIAASTKIRGAGSALPASGFSSRSASTAAARSARPSVAPPNTV